MSESNPRVILVDDRSFPAKSAQADFLVLKFSKKKVKANDPAETLTSLLHLTDSADTFNKYRNRVAFMFDGWDHDKREVYEIPVCVEFFKSLTRQWPYWIHFLELEMDSAPLAVALLASAVPAKKSMSKMKVAATPNSSEAFKAINMLEIANHRVYQHLGIPDDQAHTTYERFMTKLNDSFEIEGL